MDRVNDFAFKIATANGTGSASANGLIMQAIFRMGVPVTGKNVFPSNIQGLPTWYEIRVNKNGYTARTAQFDLMVALNAANEVAVDAFLAGRLPFPAIARVIEGTMSAHDVQEADTLEDIRAADRWARDQARTLAGGLELKV